MFLSCCTLDCMYNYFRSSTKSIQLIHLEPVFLTVFIHEKCSGISLISEKDYGKLWEIMANYGLARLTYWVLRENYFIRYHACYFFKMECMAVLKKISRVHTQLSPYIGTWNAFQIKILIKIYTTVFSSYWNH